MVTGEEKSKSNYKKRNEYMKTKAIILSIAALLTFGQTQAMCQRNNNSSKSSTSVRSGNRGSSTSKNNNTKTSSSTKNDNNKAPSTSKKNDNKSSSIAKNNNTRRESTTKSNNTPNTSTSKNNNTRRTTTIREPKKVDPPREIPKGYEDRVRYDGKNWCYLRDGKWYSYDHYIEPATYYSRPLSEFGTALIVGAVVGCLISALAN